MGEGFRRALSRCWDASALMRATDFDNLVVQIQFELDPTGMLVGEPRILPAALAVADDRYLPAAQDAAVNAVVACQPYNFLPPSRYDLWKEMQLNFDPTEMAGF